MFEPLKAAEFRVRLRDSGVLIIALESAALITPSGLPLGFPTALLGVLVAFVALILLNREFRPVLRLAKAVEALDPADPEAKLPDVRARTAEVRLLIQVFARQQERVASLLRARAALVGGIQHDVRTFATRLRLRLEKLPNPDDRARAEADITDLVALMDSALLATRNDAGKLDLELIDIAEILEAEISDRKSAGEDASLAFVPPAQEAQVLGDRVALRRIVFNLVENAIRYGNAVHLTVRTDGATVTVTVDDDGPGIPEDKRQDLLEPFARLEPSRARHTGGAGLGLAIVSGLVAGHGGSLFIGDAPTGGARITIQLPAFRTSSVA